MDSNTAPQPDSDANDHAAAGHIPAPGPTRRGVRWWPAVLILCLVVILNLMIWWSPNPEDGLTGPMLLSVLVSLAGMMLLTGWLLFFSRMRWRSRIGLLFLAPIVALLLCFATIRHVEFSGDLVPWITWRWQADPTANLPAELRPAQIDAGDAASAEFVPLADYPQFLGPERSAVLPDLELETDWEAHPPQELWRRAVGEGWSSFAVSQTSAITQQSRDEREVTVSYYLPTGDVQWTQYAEGTYHGIPAGDGPRATPTIADGRVYVMGSLGLLRCLDFASGDIIWEVDVLADSQSQLNQYGATCSPLVVDSAVVVTSAGKGRHALLAYDRETGAPLWQAGNDTAGYSSPAAALLAGVRQIVVRYTNSVAGHNPADGTVLWTYEQPINSEQHITLQPIVINESELFLPAGFGIGTRLLEVARSDDGAISLAERWHTLRFQSNFANVVCHDGYAYGLHMGIMSCVDLKTGARQWIRGRYGHGQVMLVGDVVLVLGEKGDVALVEASPKEHIELARFQAIEGKTWNHPALAPPYLLVRNAQQAACYRLEMRGAHGTP